MTCFLHCDYYSYYTTHRLHILIVLECSGCVLQANNRSSDIMHSLLLLNVTWKTLLDLF